MSSLLPPGLYERLVSLALERQVGELDRVDQFEAITVNPAPSQSSFPEFCPGTSTSFFLSRPCSRRAEKDAQEKQLRRRRARSSTKGSPGGVRPHCWTTTPEATS